MGLEDLLEVLLLLVQFKQLVEQKLLLVVGLFTHLLQLDQLVL
jgi:hypothetical protein